jgi:c-di-GMP-binding flagellar brake protein YcgR
MASGEIERREFFRISDRLLVEYREVTYSEALALEKTLRQADFEVSGPEVPAPGAGSTGLAKSELYACLESIGKKLDSVIDLLSEKERGLQSTSMDVVISGSGMMFPSPARLEKGAYLEIGVSLPVFPGQRIRTVGRVVRCDLRTMEGEESWETAVAFVAISEKDRDALVCYVFSKERECLRMRRTS